MTMYRVGEAGATVFNTEGKPIATLRPGSVVVDGTIDTPQSAAAQYHGKPDEPKMRRERSDKQRRAGRDYEDKQA